MPGISCLLSGGAHWRWLEAKNELLRSSSVNDAEAQPATSDRSLSEKTRCMRLKCS
ncbi:hypothetical protein ASPBRDRAFT_40312 [Aspergillus brasiliensis CBS 101740]|uniref:Uncharacterized protein n=1 Tax=Aspergillus brasiliensis (strain CBS 101740 / IMI 381727 / IBT 21946) TaxID=767769 RepID=A0A1L9UTU3_ASPBC|nr:hypothetical protein ASPBRDRAFT_40312 [Aspergillus brasiliensis CBS 101740]